MGNESNDELLLKPDYDFAKKLDINCNRCLERRASNETQLDALKQRKITHPREAMFPEALKNKCQACQRRFDQSITATHSCMYRGGIYKKR